MSPFLELDGAAWLEARAQSIGAGAGGGGGGGGGGGPAVFQSANSLNATNFEFLRQLRFSGAKSVRTSTIILAAFNAIAAFSTAFGILYDCYMTKKRNGRNYRSSEHPFVKAADIYPLALSIGITIQGIGFAFAQAKGLDDFNTRGCTLISQFMLPAVFIVPYIQLVFGVEVIIRGLRRKPFPPRGKWTVTICLVIIGMLLLSNFLVADFLRSPDNCFASLFWFVSQYAQGCFVILLVIAIILFIGIAIIFVRLSRSVTVDTCERVTASRMVYYLALAVLSNSLMAPFFYQLAFSDDNSDVNDPTNQALTLSMVASVVANVSGLMTGGLHLFLRSNTLSTIGPKNKAGDYERQKIKDQIRRFGPSDPNNGAHMMQPVSGAADLRRMLSDASLISSSYTKEEEATLVGRSSPTYDIVPRRPNPLRSNAVYPLEALAAKAPEPIPQILRAPSSASTRKTAYSAFSNNQGEPSKPITVLPATIYTPGSSSKNRFDFSTLKPPPSIKNLAVGRHRRDSSMASSATVQIGLRLSNVDDMPPLNSQVLDKKVYTLELANDEAKDQPPAKRPSPITTTKPAPEETTVVVDASPKRDPVRDARMKTLPPVPRNGVPNPEAVATTATAAAAAAADDDGSVYSDEQEEKIATLSPTVYQPPSPSKTKLPSPRGVGVASPPSRTNSTSVRSPPPRPNPSGSPRQAPRNSKAGDWI